MRTLSNLREKSFPNDINFIAVSNNSNIRTIDRPLDLSKTSNSKNMKQNKSKTNFNEIIISNNNMIENSSSKLTINSFQSIGKWMYESEEFATNLLINNNNNIDESDDKSSDDDIECVATFNAGPSGLNIVQESVAVCDLNPSLKLNSNELKKLEEIVFDKEITFESTISNNNNNNNNNDDNNNENEITINETITIVDLSDDNTEVEETAEVENDVEIIKVKFYNEPIELDNDIEVLSEILTPSEVIDLMKNNLKLVQQLTDLSFTTMRVVMSKYLWNKDLFVNEFYEFGIDRILSALKLVISKELKMNTKKRKTKEVVDNEEETATCIVCFDETNKSEMFGSSCNHFLCIECWNNYITIKVNDSSSDEKILCPSDNCSLLIDDDNLIDLIQEQNIRDRYQRLITNSFVTHNQLLRWCPNGSCLHAVRVKYSGFQDIECVCKTVFCFLCGEQWHEPLSCDLYKNWIQKYASHSVDPKSAEWLLKHTKYCPKCKFPIEKNGGCNYVTCTKCMYSFCYDCLGKCSHGRCIGAQRNDAIEARNEDLRLKSDLHLYPFYKNSYQNQLKQLNLERKLQEGVNNKLEKAIKSLEFKSALKFLKNAFTVLCHCRQTLMYSYVFGYYLAGPQNQINVYIENMGELEKETINLSTILTRETTVIHKDSVIEMKKSVQSSYRKCENKRSELVRHIKHGLTGNYWQFIPK